ncbi:MAG: PadR family transcriptional regulator [Mycobacteriales bacterium]
MPRTKHSRWYDVHNLTFHLHRTVGVEVRVPPDPAGSPTSIVRKAFEDLPSSVDVGLRRVLSALAAGPLHGYAVIKEVSRLSADRVQLAAGTLYAALDRLSDEGLVEGRPRGDCRWQAPSVLPAHRSGRLRTGRRGRADEP